MTAPPLRVFLPCTGLGREVRGFEAFTRDCAAALRADPGIEVTVLGGGGAMEPGERAVWNLPRAGPAARLLGGMTGRDPYFIEQASFFAGFLPALIAGRPHVVYFADLNLGNACWHWRRASGQSFKLLYYNGGPTTRPFTRCDLVQQVSPEHLASAIARGERRERQVLLPHGVSIERAFAPVTGGERRALRATLGVPAEGPLVLSVGALNDSHKRMGYVIAEVAAMASRPHLLLLGAETAETPAVRARAAALLGDRCTVRTLPRAEVRAAYRAADVFVLASLIEGFGLAQVEALAAGLPCVAHDSPTSRYVLGPHGVRADLRVAGALAPVLDRVLAAGIGDARGRHDRAWAEFSWDRLAPSYAELLHACAEGRTPAFWTSSGEFDEAWKRRIERMASLITAPGVVADFGCGLMWLESMLSPRNSYLPIDFVRRDERTTVLDLNADSLDGVHADVAFLSGVLEYVEDLPGLAGRLQDRAFRQIIASYCTLDDHPNMQERRRLNWKSHLSEDALKRLFLTRYDLSAVDHVGGDTILAFTRKTP